MPLSVEKAIRIVDSYLPGECNDNRYMQSDSILMHPSTDEVMINPQRRILPAFRETWRGGPNIISPNQGTYFVSADCIWHDRNRVSEEELEEVAHQSDIAKHGKQLASMIPECMKCDKDALPVISATSPRERDINGLVKRSCRDRIKLHRSCRLHYMHGALGLQETPYGHTGEFYKDIQQRLANAKSQTICPIKRQVQYREDSLFGSIALKESYLLRRKGGLPPDDHLFSSMHIDDSM